ncbi:diguanylate cyclase (GGDEF) domain-containing protein [Klenkia soli]|uniref:Diguanylate cyclase (GGDEF) domain-containing protein n=1 Tax=Klenkia soli TaxID=1052260 RepID=A0A1H0Q6G0_9ACTN|nr:GGDEF domain-containing protein [Klenkia soli]SDP12296.1 diguanylate cyclase (GGDEF) domain-containing protein [Klenkia soli]
MVETLAVLFTAGTLVGILVALGSELSPTRRLVVGGIVASTSLATVALVTVGRRLPRRVLEGLVGGSALLIALAIAIPLEPSSAVALACLLAFIVVDACYFFSRPVAVGHVLGGFLAVDGSLLLRGDVPLPTVLALDTIMVALAVVTYRLARRASGASSDPLTGLPNRRAFDDALQDLVRDGRTSSVALLDLDHFKEINDTAGHEAGDRVLLRVAEVQLPAGALLARHGGDEFALLLPGRAGEEAVATVWRMCDQLAGVGLSCGVAEVRAGESAAQLMRRADGALYAAKAAGRGRVEFAATTPSRGRR